MIAPRRDTVARVLKLVDQAGPNGIDLGGFAAKWPTRLPKGRDRKTNAPIGRFLGDLVRSGLLVKDILGQYTVTKAGRVTLADFEAEVEKSRGRERP